MRNSLKNGVCVSCERHAGRHASSCPYCGEQVWRPRWWLAGRWCSLFLPPVLLACLTGLARPDWLTVIRRFQNASPSCALLFAVGLGLLLLPPQDHEFVISSVSELRRRQACAFFGGWALGLYAILGTASVTSMPVPMTILLAGGLAATVSLMPFFLHIHWLSLTAAIFFAISIALSR